MEYGAGNALNRVVLRLTSDHIGISTYFGSDSLPCLFALVYRFTVLSTMPRVELDYVLRHKQCCTPYGGGPATSYTDALWWPCSMYSVSVRSTSAHCKCRLFHRNQGLDKMTGIECHRHRCSCPGCTFSRTRTNG